MTNQRHRLHGLTRIENSTSQFVLIREIRVSFSSFVIRHSSFVKGASTQLRASNLDKLIRLRHCDTSFTPNSSMSHVPISSLN